MPNSTKGTYFVKDIWRLPADLRLREFCSASPFALRDAAGTKEQRRSTWRSSSAAPCGGVVPHLWKSSAGAIAAIARNENPMRSLFMADPSPREQTRLPESLRGKDANLKGLPLCSCTNPFLHGLDRIPMGTLGKPIPWERGCPAWDNPFSASCRQSASTVRGK